MSEPANGETGSDGVNTIGTAVVFGAGATGRGIIAPAFAAGGLETIFIETDAALVEAINRRGKYDVSVVRTEPGSIRETQTVAPVRAIHSRDRVRAAGEIALAKMVCFSSLNSMAETAMPTLAAGLLARRKSLATPLNVLLRNRNSDIVQIWRQTVGEHLPEKNREDVLAQTGFVRILIPSRIVSACGQDGNLLDVSVMPTGQLEIETNGLIETLPDLPGFEAAADFEARVARRQLDNCVTYVLGYLGYAAGHEYGWQALDDARIAALIRAVQNEIGQALVAEHGFAPDAQATYEADQLAYLANPATTRLVCRTLAINPVGMLEMPGGLISAARLCERHGIAPVALAWAIVAALRHHDAENGEAVKLQTRLRDNGLEATLWQVCEIAPGEALGRRIEEVWQATNNGAV